jgi:hypothetical protein
MTSSHSRCRDFPFTHLYCKMCPYHLCSVHAFSIGGDSWEFVFAHFVNEPAFTKIQPQNVWFDMWSINLIDSKEFVHSRKYNHKLKPNLDAEISPVKIYPLCSSCRCRSLPCEGSHLLLSCLVCVHTLHFQCTIPFPISKHMQFPFPMPNVLHKCMYSMLSSGTSGFTANEMTIRDHVTFM